MSEQLPRHRPSPMTAEQVAGAIGVGVLLTGCAAVGLTYGGIAVAKHAGYQALERIRPHLPLSPI